MTADELLTLDEVAEELDVHYMTVYKRVRTGRLSAVKQGGRWMVAKSELEARPRTRTSAHPMNGGRDRTERLIDRLVVGDESGAWRIVDDSMAAGADPARIHLEMLGPAMVTIGNRWEAGELTVAHEHRASVVVHRLIARLGPRLTSRGRRRGVIVLGAVAGDQHGLPTAMLAELLKIEHFEVIDLGANTPAASFIDAASSVDGLLAIGICLTTRDLEAGARATIDILRPEIDPTPILIGGSAVTSAAQAAEIGADDWATTGPDAVQVVERWVSSRASR